MYLNKIRAALGAKTSKKRVGRGIGSGLGKTCGKGHKGQKSRSGGYHKVGFEGGQMPLQRRLPKFGFVSRKSKFSDQVTLTEINNLVADVVDLALLKEAGIVTKQIKFVKVFLSGTIERKVTISGLKVTRGAKAAIEAAGGKVE